MAIFEAHYGKEHWQLAATLGNLASTHGSLGDPHQQKALLERALAIQEAHYGKDHGQVGATRHNLAGAYLQLEDHVSAYQHSQQAKDILINAPGYGENHPWTQAAIKRADKLEHITYVRHFSSCNF